MWILQSCFAPSPHNRSRDVKAGALQEIRWWRLYAGGKCCLQLQVAWLVTAQLVLKIRHRRSASDNTKFWKRFLSHGLTVPSVLALCNPTVLARTHYTKSWPLVGNYFKKLAPHGTGKINRKSCERMWYHICWWHRFTFFLSGGG